MIWLRKSPNPFSFSNVRISLEFQHKGHPRISPLLDSFPDKSRLPEFLARQLSLAMLSFQGFYFVQHQIENQFFVVKKEPFQYLLLHGQPLAHSP